MNRSERIVSREKRRAAEAREKMQRNTSRVKELVETGHTLADELDRYKAIVFSLAREQGRIRVRAEQLRKLGENDRVDFIHQENGDVIVQYTAGSQ